MIRIEPSRPSAHRLAGYFLAVMPPLQGLPLPPSQENTSYCRLFTVREWQTFHPQMTGSWWACLAMPPSFVVAKGGYMIMTRRWIRAGRRRDVSLGAATMFALVCASYGWLFYSTRP